MSISHKILCLGKEFTFEKLLQKILQQLSQGLNTFNSAIAGAQAGDIAEYALEVENQAIIIVRDIAGDIVSAIAVMDMEYKLKTLEMAKLPSNRADLLSYLNMSKPRSPKQQYLTTLKGS